jgi:hypothetical protein
MRAFAKLMRPVNTIEGLREHLQVAIELEHSTIPAYLYAMYSIKEGSNQQAAMQIRSVVMEEMLHMTLAANILNAIGGHPDLTTQEFTPEYPTYLPQSDEAFVVNLARFSPETVKTFMRIEKPEKTSSQQPRWFGYSTIGEFYAAIRNALGKVCKNNQHFIKDHSAQVTSEYYYNAGGEVFPVTNLEEARKALKVIVEQGEGTKDDIHDNDPVFGQRAEPAHYFRYNEIHEGRYYTEQDTPKSGPTGAPMAVDWTAVYPARTNPKASDYPAGSQIREMCDDFNRTYMDLLGAINDGFNSKQQRLVEAVQIMYQLKYKAVALMKIPYHASGETAGPSFEWIKATTWASM